MQPSVRGTPGNGGGGRPDGRFPRSDRSGPNRPRRPRRDPKVRDMAAIETPAPPAAGALPAGLRAPRRTRLVAMTAFAMVAGTWWLGLGIPADPFTTFAWLWLAAIAWRWGVPLRRHLDFAPHWWPALATLLFYTYTRGFADQLGITPHQQMPITVDRWIGFGELPTQRLQHWLCGTTCADMGAGRWYDTFFTATYVTHFV